MLKKYYKHTITYNNGKEDITLSYNYKEKLKLSELVFLISYEELYEKYYKDESSIKLVIQEAELKKKLYLITTNIYLLVE